MTDEEIPEGYEYAEVSAAKDIALAVLTTRLPEGFDLIGIADRIISDLMEAGVTIPEGVGSPFVR